MPIGVSAPTFKAYQAIPDILGKWELLADSGNLSGVSDWNSGAITTRRLMMVLFATIPDGNGASIVRLRLNNLSGANYEYLGVEGTTWTQFTAKTFFSLVQAGSVGNRWQVMGQVLIPGSGNSGRTPVAVLTGTDIGLLRMIHGAYVGGGLTITSIQLLWSTGSSGNVKIYGVDL